MTKPGYFLAREVFMKKSMLTCLLVLQSLFAYEQFDNPTELIQKIVDANYQHNPEIFILQLFDLNPDFFENVSKEVLQLIHENQPSYATSPTHNSYWSRPEGMISQFSLLNVSGILSDYSADHNLSSKNKKFFHGDRYPNLATFISLFPDSTNFRINVLHEKSHFTQHQEDICVPNQISNKPSLKLRFHLPILTNKNAVMLMQGDAYHFDPGTIYFFHNGCIHDGVNMSESEPRVHLLWDMLLTKDTFARMFERSISMGLLTKLDDVSLTPAYHVGIDPNYKKTNRRYSYQEACQITLCPPQ